MTHMHSQLYAIKSQFIIYNIIIAIRSSMQQQEISCVKIWIDGVSIRAWTVYTKSFDDVSTKCGWWFLGVGDCELIIFTV